MIPTPYTLLVERWEVGTEPNPHGNYTGSYSAPQALPVHGYAPGPSKESVAAGRASDEVLWTVYAPQGTSIKAKDKVTLNGTVYEVDGDSLDYSHSPWLTTVGGVVFELKRQGG